MSAPDNYNMSIRQFLKEVGVTSQRAMEEALRDAAADGGAFEAKVVLTVPGLGVEHVVTGTIAGADSAESGPS
ncbi:MAG: DUF6494 family protein [Pseudomonadota bacterium]